MTAGNIQEIDIVLRGLAETQALAARIADVARPGLVVLLDGPVGVGKSELARAVTQNLLAREGRSEDVPSPTFTLVQTYETAGFEIWHADLYRLTSPDELIELGLEGAFETAFCLIEWPDRMPPLPASQAVLRIDLAQGVDDTTRHAALAGLPGDIASLVEART